MKFKSLQICCRSEGYLMMLDRTLYGSDPARAAMRTRSYSENDSERLQQRMEDSVQSSSTHRLSITEILLGRRSFYSRNESVVTQTVEEVSDSMENVTEETITMSIENDTEQIDEPMSQTDGNQASTTRETTQTDHLNKRLLDAFLSRLSNIAGVNNSGTVFKGDNEAESSGEYSTVYSDDLLMDRIYRRINNRKKS